MGGLPGTVLVGDEAGERADGGEVGEPGGVAEAAGDLGRADATHARSGAHDTVGVDLLVQLSDALVQGVDLIGDGQREPRLAGDVGGERVEVMPSRPHSFSVASAAAMTAAARSWCHAPRL